MLHVSTSIKRFWPDMVHLEIQDKRGGWCRSLRWAAFMYTFVLIASSWLCILSTHVKKKCCYQSTAWRTQCRSILKKKVLKQRLKKHMHERSKVKCLAAQWGDYFFLHVCMYVCQHGCHETYNCPPQVKSSADFPMHSCFFLNNILCACENGLF